MAQFNVFEDAIDFTFWKEIFEKQGKLRHFRRGECFAHTGEVLRYQHIVRKEDANGHCSVGGFGCTRCSGVSYV